MDIVNVIQLFQFYVCVFPQWSSHHVTGAEGS